MKQRLTKKADFHSNPDIKKYEILHQTELRVQRLERIIESLLFWKEGSTPYEEARLEYIEDYVESGYENN